MPPKGFNAYKTNSITTQTPGQIVVMLYDGAIRFLKESCEAIEKNDYADSAKCMLVGIPTPSVMVSLRGAEATLREYYKRKTQKDPKKLTWRQITKELKDNSKQWGLEENFIGFLDYIGDAKRNFAQHPNKIFSIREASIIFMQIIALVEDVYTKLLST